MDNNQTMGRRIAAHRKRMGLTQDQLAEKVGVSPQAVSKWENDLSCPDISTLPLLARIFGVSTDSLLGVEPETAAEPSPQDKQESHTFEVQVDAPKRPGLAFAAWFIAVGAMMLAGYLLGVQVSVWSAMWMMGLTVFGVFSLFTHFSLPGAAAALAGLYFAAGELELIRKGLGWNVAFPCLIVLLGIGLLIDALRGKHRSWGFHVNAPGKSGTAQVEDGVLSYSHSFSESRYCVQAPLFRGGEISVSFGEHTLDFTGVQRIAADCRLRVNSSFGETRLIVPRRFRVEMNATSSFGDIKTGGRCDDAPEGTIFLGGSVSFGELSVEYV